jgi:hypothetical protein
MSGSGTKTVEYHDHWDVGKDYSTPDKYDCSWHGTSDTIDFKRDGKTIVCMSKGEAWLFMNALVYMFDTEGGDIASHNETYVKGKNPFYTFEIDWVETQQIATDALSDPGYPPVGEK